MLAAPLQPPQIEKLSAFVRICGAEMPVRHQVVAALAASEMMGVSPLSAIRPLWGLLFQGIELGDESGTEQAFLDLVHENLPAVAREELERALYTAG